jgi:hypothetical protein
MKPAGPLPQFKTWNASGEPGEPITIPREAWRALRPPAESFISEFADPFGPAPANAEEWEIESKKYGPGRIGTTVRQWAGKSRRPKIHPSFIRERFEWWPNVPSMYRRSVQILKYVGFDNRAPWHWVFADTDGRWWAISDQSLSANEIIPIEELNTPQCFRVDFELGLGACQLPPSFFEDLGGTYGPLEWAFEVAIRVRYLRQISKSIQTDNPARNLQISFEFGFELGAKLGFMYASDRIKQNEALRTPKKTALRAAIRSIVMKEARNGPIRPYALAKKLIRENNTTERGKLLMDLGRAADFNTLGTMIREEANAAGL